MSAEVEYERTRDRARAFLAAIDELTAYKEQVGFASGKLESEEEGNGYTGTGTEKGKEEDVELMNSLQIAIERLNVKFRETAGELSHRANDLITRETFRNHLRQQANLYSAQRKQNSNVTLVFDTPTNVRTYSAASSHDVFG